MKPLKLSTTVRTVVIVTLGLGVTGAVVRAAGTKKFWQQRQAMQAELRAAQEAEGLSGGANRKALYAKYPTPEITLCKPVLAQPGATVTLSVTGKFADKTRFLIANDSVELGEGTVTAGKYSVSVTSAPDTMPSYARLHAISPVSGANDSCGALFVGPVAAYDLRTDNGWTIKLTPSAKAFTVGSNEATLPYVAAFFKRDEPEPFKKMSTTMTIREDDDPGKELHLSLQAMSGDGSAEAELAALQTKMSEPNLLKKVGMTEFQRMATRMSKLLEAQMKKMEAEMADPNYAQKAQQEQDAFGCGSLMFTVANGRASGNMTCGKNVGTDRGRVKVSGTTAAAATPTAGL